jgi:hypothetical protein
LIQRLKLKFVQLLFDFAYNFSVRVPALHLGGGGAAAALAFVERLVRLLPPLLPAEAAAAAKEAEAVAKAKAEATRDRVVANISISNTKLAKDAEIAANMAMAGVKGKRFVVASVAGKSAADACNQ